MSVHSRSSPSLVGLVLALLVTTALAGCFGSGGDDAPEVPQDPSDPNDPKEPGGGGSGGTGGGNGEPNGPDDEDDDEGEDENVPSAHYHHYWGENPPLPAVTIFDGPVELDFGRDCVADTEQRPGCFEEGLRLGWTRFNLEDDGNQVDETAREAHADGHADTVFTGTSEVTVTFSWDEDLVGNALRFYYKPANSPGFLPREDENPIILTKDDASRTIPLSSGMADPAHQFWVSRWAFMLVAEGGPTEDWEYETRLAKGVVDVEMVAVNGGKQYIDPPHPDPWKGRDMIRYENVAGDFEMVAVHAEHEGEDYRVVNGERHDGIEMPYRATVPAGTETLVVRAWVNATDEVSKQVDWGLKYHGSYTLSYTYLDEYTDGENGERVYEIAVQEIELDPPYEKESYFRFGFFPILADQQEVGWLQAEYGLGFEVHKDPEFTYYY